jgi:hypothetical protein
MTICRYIHPTALYHLCTVFWLGDLRERNHLEDLGIDGGITTKWISKGWDGWAWTGWIWFRIEMSGWHLLCGNEHAQISPIEVNFTYWGHVTFWGRTLLHGTCSWPITIHLWRHNWQTNRGFYNTCVKFLNLAVTKDVQKFCTMYWVRHGKRLF